MWRPVPFFRLDFKWSSPGKCHPSCDDTCFSFTSIIFKACHDSTWKSRQVWNRTSQRGFFMSNCHVKNVIHATFLNFHHRGSFSHVSGRHRFFADFQCYLLLSGTRTPGSHSWPCASFHVGSVTTDMRSQRIYLPHVDRALFLCLRPDLRPATAAGARGMSPLIQRSGYIFWWLKSGSTCASRSTSPDTILWSPCPHQATLTWSRLCPLKFIFFCISKPLSCWDECTANTGRSRPSWRPSSRKWGTQSYATFMVCQVGFGPWSSNHPGHHSTCKTSAECYARDNLAKPMRDFDLVLQQTRTRTFLPDSTRSEAW